jgi:hypothetical protein
MRGPASAFCDSLASRRFLTRVSIGAVPAPEGDPEKPLPLQFELPRPEVGAPAAPLLHVAPTVPLRALAKRALWILSAVLAAAIALFYGVLPWYIRRACVDEAEAHGLTLEIDGVEVGFRGFRLVGVRAAAVDIPQASLLARDVSVVASGLQPQNLTAHGLELSLIGDFRTIAAAVAKWRASSHGGQNGAWAPESLLVDGARVVWQRPIGENARAEAGGVHLDAVWRDRSLVVRAGSDNVAIAVPQGTLGPWRVDVERSPGTFRVRVVLDPGVPDACTILAFGDAEAITSVDVVVPRSPLLRLGVPPQLFGIAQELQVDSTIHYARRSPHRIEVTAKGGIFGLQAQGLKTGTDILWDVVASGDPQEGADAKPAQLAVGPLVGPLRGTFRTFDDGFRLDLAWRSAALPCAALDVPVGSRQLSEIAHQFRKLAEAASAARLSGTVAASGTLAFDSRDLAATTLTFIPEVKCPR